VGSATPSSWCAESQPLAATEFYTVLEASDVPDGVINVVTGAKDALAKCWPSTTTSIGIWYFGTAGGGGA